MKKKKIIKEFKVFPSGSSGYNTSREIESKEDDIQLLKEIDKGLKRGKG